MRIGIDIRNIGKRRTGDEVVFFNLVKNLAEIDSSNHYFLFTDITDTTMLRSMVVLPLGIENKKNFKVISLKCPNKFIWNIWTLPRYLKNNPVEIYHTQYIIPFFLPKKIRVFTTIHDVSFNYFPEYIKKTDLFFLKTLIPWSLKKASRIIAVSEFTKKEIIRTYDIKEDKIDVVLNALADNFLNQTIPSEDIRKKYKLPEKYILYLGTLEPRKNIPVIIQGFARVKDKLPDYKLVIAGKRGHNYDQHIDEVIKSENLAERVVFPGYIEEIDKPAVFRMSELFVTMSLYEGFGIPILEAVSQGTPVLVSDIEPHREIAENIAIFAQPSSIDEISNNMYNIIIGSLPFDSSEAIKNSLLFSWKNSAKTLLNIYNKK